MTLNQQRRLVLDTKEYMMTISVIMIAFILFVLNEISSILCWLLNVFNVVNGPCASCRYNDYKV